MKTETTTTPTWSCQNVTARMLAHDSSIEHELIQTPVFLDNSLSLYCGVFVQDLIPAEDAEHDLPAPDSSQSECRVDYLVCQGNEVLLAFNLLPKEHSLTRLLTLCIMPEQYDNAVRLIGQALEKCLDDETPRAWQYRTQPVSAELRAQLAGERLLYQQGLMFHPTEYGRDCGIANRYYVHTDGRVRQDLACSDRTRRRLDEILAWGRDTDAGIAWETLPLSERIDRLNRGLPSNSAYSVSVVQRFAKTPLDEYLRDFPDALSELREILPPEAVTYQQAATAIYQMMQSGSDCIEGRRQMLNLAVPFIRSSKTAAGA